jgi:hypothetical protein
MKKSIFGGMLFALCLSMVACGNTVTGDGDDDDNGDGGGGGGTTSDTAAFVGMWNYSTGTGTLTCPNEPDQTLSAMGVLTITAGSTAGTITTSSTANGSNCVTVFTVSGNAATANAGQTCTLSGTDDEGETITEMRTASGSFTVVNNTLTANIGGADVVNEGGETFDCNIAGTITYTKI